MAILSNKDILRKKERKFLPDVIPLPAPFVMFIEPTNICNFECKFCPTGNKELLKNCSRPNGFMPLELFKKLVDDLKEFPEKIKLINLWKDGESFLHPDFPEMCQYLGQANVTERFIARTNGTRLDPEFCKKIIASGINEIGISVEAVSDEKYFQLTRRKFSYKNLVKQVEKLYEIRENCRIYVKIIDVDLNEEEKKRFYDDFSGICDFCTIENLMGWSGDVFDFKLGKEVNASQGGSTRNTNKVCTLPFTQLAVNHDGSVSTCNADWMHKTVVGSITESSLLNIRNGEKLKSFRELHLQHLKDSNDACRKCDFIFQDIDSLDGYEEQILSRLDG